MRELAVELKQLRMHGMASAWSDLMEQGGSAALESSRWLLEHLLQAARVRHFDPIFRPMRFAGVI